MIQIIRSVFFIILIGFALTKCSTTSGTTGNTNPVAVCGDGVCQSSETNITCASDCGSADIVLSVNGGWYTAGNLSVLAASNYTENYVFPCTPPTSYHIQTEDTSISGSAYLGWIAVSIYDPSGTNFGLDLAADNVTGSPMTPGSTGTCRVVITPHNNDPNYAKDYAINIVSP